MYEIQDDVFFHGEQRDSKQSQNHELDWTDLPQHRSVGDQTARHAEISIDQTEEGKTAAVASQHSFSI